MCHFTLKDWHYQGTTIPAFLTERAWMTMPFYTCPSRCGVCNLPLIGIGIWQEKPHYPQIIRQA